MCVCVSAVSRHWLDCVKPARNGRFAGSAAVVSGNVMRLVICLLSLDLDQFRRS